MRKLQSYSSFLSSIPLSLNEDCTAPDYKECNITTPHLTPSSSVSFTSCTFTHLTSNKNGGAICFHDKSPGSLTVSECYFDTCITDSVSGGAIYVDSISSIDVQLSVFIRCKCMTSDNNDGGGGIYIINIFVKPSVSLCDFLDCYSKEDGGALDIQNSYSQQQNVLTVSNCRFISNSAFAGFENVGGGVCNWGNNPVVGVTNCLFSHNLARGRAGGLFLEFTKPVSRIIRFSMFVDNKSENNDGHDVNICSSIPDEPFFFCLSTTTITPRVDPTGNDDHWLTSANIHTQFTASEGIQSNKGTIK